MSSVILVDANLLPCACTILTALGTALAAIAIEHGATVCSTDRDFARFPGLDWINPLET